MSTSEQQPEAPVKRPFFSKPLSFFCIFLPIPLCCSAVCWMYCDDIPELIGWVFPLITLGLFLVAGMLAGVSAWCKRDVLPQASVLWRLLLAVGIINAMSNFRLYEAFGRGGFTEGMVVCCGTLLLTMGGICLFWSILKRWSVMLWVPFMLLGVWQAIGFLEYGTVLNSLVLAEVLETSLEEALAYLNPMNIAFITLTFVVAGVLCWRLCRILRGQKRLTLLSSAFIFLATGMLIGLPVPVEDEDTVLYWPYSEGYRLSLTLDEALHANVATIDCASALPNPAKDPSSISTLKGGEGVVLVMHIGESVRADRMSVNGYERDTTPWLRSQVGKGLINFPRCVSVAGDTCQAQIAILTDGRRDVHEKDPALQPHVGSVLNLFAANGFDVYCFRGHRCAEKLKYDLVIHLLTRCARRCFNAPGSPWTAVPLMGEVLKENTDGQNLVFFINNEGSHTPFYHYDHDNTPFTPAIDSFEIPSRHAVEVNNAYDSTIHYTDEYFRRVAEQLKGRPFIYVYVSDHGEYLGHDGIWGRGGLGSSSLSYHDTTGCLVGMFVYYSPEFEQLHPHFAEALKQLSANTGLTVAHEHVFHTLLGLFGIQTQHYNADLDLTTPTVNPYDGPQPAIQEP